jgi:hypothetical protein
MEIRASVGRVAPNSPDDVRIVQELLRETPWPSGPIVFPQPTGVCDAQTIYVIESFQRNVLGMASPTGRVNPKDRTWYALNGQSGAAPSRADEALDETLQLLRDEAVNFSQRFINDQGVRAQYVAKAEAAAAEILKDVQEGRLTPAAGAEKARQMRNGLLDASRLKTSDIGKAVAELEKATGKSMEALLATKSKDLFGREFASLAAAEQDAVLVAIVKSAGRPNARFTALANGLGKAGKGLIIVSIAFSVYKIAESERPGREAIKEGASTGVGFLGSLAGGAAAGLVCGPGAPICVGVGVVVGGLVFALGTDLAFDSFWE